MQKVLTELAVLDIKTDITPDNLLSDFMRNFDSQVLREKYLVNTRWFKDSVQDKTDSPEIRNRLISKILNGNIGSHSSTKDNNALKKEYRYYEVYISAENPTAARDLLEGYINYVSRIVEQELHQRLNYQVDMLKAVEIGRYELDLTLEKNVHQVKLERLKYALLIANSAGLKKPSWSKGTIIQDDPDFSVILGADGLQRKLVIEQSITDPTELNANLQNRRLRIEKLNNLQIDDLSVESFKYMRSPYEPVMRDAPKRLFIVLLFTLAGFIVSCGWVLMRNIMLKHRKNDSHLQR